MNFDEEALIQLARVQNPRLTYAEAARFARGLRHMFLDVVDLVSSKNVQSMRKVVSSVDSLMRKLRDVMDDKELCHFFSAFGGVISFVGLLAAANPVGILMLGAGALMGFGFGIGAASKSKDIHQKLRQIENIIKIDRMDFRLVAQKIRSLDEHFQRYLMFPLFSEENRQFLRSAAEYVFTEKHSRKGNNDDRIIDILRNLAIAESLAQLYGAITGCAVVGSFSAMVPLLAIGMQTLLLIKDIDDNKDTIAKLSAGVASMRKKLEVLDILYEK